MAHAALTLAWIDETLPWDPATASIVVRHDGAVLGARSVTPATPQVTLTSPNGGELWAATGEATITWTESHTTAATWRSGCSTVPTAARPRDTIRRQVAGGSYTVDLRDFPGTDRALVRDPRQ